MTEAMITLHQIPPMDEAIADHWETNAEDIDLFGISALCEPAMQYPWSMCINAAEFVRTEPLQSLFRQQISDALAAVEGVSGLEEAGQDVWLIGGEPTGPALIEAVLAVLLALESEIRRCLPSSAH